MNKIIVKQIEKDVAESATKLRRLNATLDNYSDEDIEHSGVLGMKWGVRKSDDAGGSSGFKLNKKTPVGKIVTAAKKVKDFYEKPDKDFAQATKGMSVIKRELIRSSLGPYFGTRFVNSQKNKAQSDPKFAAKVAKREMKLLRTKIFLDFDRRSDAELNAHNMEFATKYGRTRVKQFFTKAGRAKMRKDADVYTKTLTTRMEKVLNDVAKDNLAGSSYKIKDVSGFNDFLPSFTLTNGNDSIKHSDILEHSEKSWNLVVKLGIDGLIEKLSIPEEFLDIQDDEVEFANMPDIDEEELDDIEHSGVRGMRWGIRKEDSSGSGEAKKSHLQRSFEQKYDKSGKVAKLINKAKASTPEKKVIAERKSKAKNRRVISDEDLKKTIDRIQMEKKIKSLIDEDLAPGKIASLSFLAKVGSSAAMAAAGVAGAALMKKYLSSKGIGG